MFKPIASSNKGWPTSVAGNPFNLHISSSNGRIHSMWSTKSCNFESLLSPPFQAQNEGAA
uniref:Uncharacterized protein n=1 Tax=Arundo donax TaxID=35708 RepID=A0A0A9HQH7_ARUDO